MAFRQASTGCSAGPGPGIAPVRAASPRNIATSPGCATARTGAMPARDPSSAATTRTTTARPRHTPARRPGAGVGSAALRERALGMPELDVVIPPSSPTIAEMRTDCKAATPTTVRHADAHVAASSSPEDSVVIARPGGLAVGGDPAVAADEAEPPRIEPRGPFIVRERARASAAEGPGRPRPIEADQVAAQVRTREVASAPDWGAGGPGRGGRGRGCWRRGGRGGRDGARGDAVLGRPAAGVAVGVNAADAPGLADPRVAGAEDVPSLGLGDLGVGCAGAEEARPHGRQRAQEAAARLWRGE